MDNKLHIFFQQKFNCDGQITFWDAYDCQPIRVLDGSLSSEMYCLDVSPDGNGYVSGGVDREVKLWNYDEGHCYFIGLGHSSPITRVSFLIHQDDYYYYYYYGFTLGCEAKETLTLSNPID